MVYCSNELFYKNPYGAVCQSTSVTFKLKLEKKHQDCEPKLVIRLDSNSAKEYTMHKTEVLPTGEAIFCVQFLPEKVGLYYYYFDLYVDFIKIYKGEMGIGFMSTARAEEFQLTVYEKDFQTPDSFCGGTMYQIFPDRFYESRPHLKMPYENRVYRPDKDGEPYFWPNELGGHLNLDYFGGDLQGIVEKMPYLKNLGANIIYLNPIFEAHSNHRYNTADYLKIDPILGTENDFIAMCNMAKQYGIKIILDGVFSHTGSDSVYFNKDGRYPTLGAFQNEHSPYRSWFDFSKEYECGYRSWWGFETLPEVNEHDPAFRKFICGDGGVIKKWLSLGADGFRLDVADELPDDFIAEIRAAVKSCGQDKILLGEVWEDATNKWSYGTRRTYLLGKGLDSVMNYPFRNAVIQLLKDGDAQGCANTVLEICENYPKPALDTAMNFLSTHDTERIVTVLMDEEINGRDRYWQSGRVLADMDLETGKKLLQLAYAFLFFMPGIPCVYYGDEIAMEGYKDPFNRGYYNWCEKDNRLRKIIKALATIRTQNPVFKKGGIKFLQAKDKMVVIQRSDNTGISEICINASKKPVQVCLLENKITVQPYNFAIRSEVVQK